MATRPHGAVNRSNIKKTRCFQLESMKSGASSGDDLVLSVKGKLSNQELELLRKKLAEAVAYDHIPEETRAERQAKAKIASKPMTKVYRKVEQSQNALTTNSHRPIRKTLASIQYENRFVGKSFDTLNIRPTKGINSAAKTTLQDEYVTKPRQISTIPRNFMSEPIGPECDASPEATGKSGKRMAPTAIPQVFIL